MSTSFLLIDASPARAKGQHVLPATQRSQPGTPDSCRRSLPGPVAHDGLPLHRRMITHCSFFLCYRRFNLVGLPRATPPRKVLNSQARGVRGSFGDPTNENFHSRSFLLRVTILETLSTYCLVSRCSAEWRIDSRSQRVVNEESRRLADTCSPHGWWCGTLSFGSAARLPSDRGV